jgi:hypothetical protein
LFVPAGCGGAVHSIISRHQVRHFRRATRCSQSTSDAIALPLFARVEPMASSRPDLICTRQPGSLQATGEETFAERGLRTLPSQNAALGQKSAPLITSRLLRFQTAFSSFAALRRDCVDLYRVPRGHLADLELGRGGRRRLDYAGCWPPLAIASRPFGEAARVRPLNSSARRITNQLELLHEVFPAATRIAVLVNLRNRQADREDSHGCAG